ncbi:hypothetical protein H6P81_008594 [Aristolochia fimbriata]|uniref:Plant UBX domain-containing protein 4 n=1 Tax=Aristolochia fimbriata TaxID=158543 RepID=A0AAV7EJX5_ARIFI|nr:hypothetical protein H6P81_008594 [Aristolochia fimbriata]
METSCKSSSRGREATSPSKWTRRRFLFLGLRLFEFLVLTFVPILLFSTTTDDESLRRGSVAILKKLSELSERCRLLTGHRVVNPSFFCRRPGPGSDSDSDGPPEYYTGGEKSGMLVQDPTKGGDSGNDVDSIFDQARQLGAMEGPIDPIHPSSSSRSFSGTGRLLSGETVSAPRPQEPEVVIHSIVFWRNGFTVNDGPLRRLDDPENASFLESIRKSECPKELEPADRKTAVHVNLIRKEEDRPEPEKRHAPFQGVGRTLGGGSSSADPAPGSQIAASTPTNAPTPSPGLVVDDTKPSTSIQLRLADGTRMVARFNFHHTVADIRAFIDASRPGGSRGYQLQTVGFPPKLLTDSNQTIEHAGLANSVVIQKL